MENSKIETVSSALSKIDTISSVIALIELVQQHPCLWDSSLKSYARLEDSTLAWQKIAKKAGDTERNCRERWKNIRCAFVRSLKPTRKPYYLADYMSFLIPFTKLKGSTGYAAGDNSHRKIECDSSGSDDELTSTDTFKYEVNSPSSSDRLAIDNSEERDPPQKRKRDTLYVASDATSTQQIEMTTPVQEISDEDLMFFQSLLPDVKRLDSRRKRRFKEKVLTLLNNDLDEVEKEVNSFSWSSSP